METPRHFEHDGLTFDYLDTATDGEAVVLLHGYPGSHRSWDRVAPALMQAGYRVVILDQRGYSPGARPRGRRAYALDRLTGDLLALADAAGVDRFHVVGHDWGGAVCWAAAASRPDRLLSMTSLSTPHLRALLRSILSSAQALRSSYMLLFQIPWLPELVLTGGPGGRVFVRTLVESGLSEARAVEYLALMRSGAAGPALNWYRAIPFHRPDRINEISVPTLYLYGTGDRFLDRRAADLTARYVTGRYRFEALEGVGHWIPEEHAEVIRPILLDHLRASADSTPR
jgi:pimeloyl-ACP methyl ester carboxylesterase